MSKSSSVLMIELDDPRTGLIAEMLANKSAKKILEVLAEKEMSESEIAEVLGMKLNTAEYNIKKLIDAGLIEKHKRVFWSSKGKKIDYYVLADKKIVISPRKMVRGILPAFIVTGLIGLGIKVFGVGENRMIGGENAGSVGMAVPGSEGVGEMIVEKSAESLIASGEVVTDSVVREVITKPMEYIDSGMQIAGSNGWAWFLLGAWLSLLIFVAWSTWSERGK